MADFTSSYVLSSNGDGAPFSPKASLGERTTTSPIPIPAANANANANANTPAPHAIESYAKLVSEEAASAFPTNLEVKKVTPDANTSTLAHHHLTESNNIKPASAENNEAPAAPPTQLNGNLASGKNSTAPPQSPYQTLKGKVALITGASRGIGAGIALELGARGAFIIVNYVKGKSGAEAMVSQIEQYGSKAVAVQADVSKVPEITALFEAGIGHFGKIDIVVSNSGTESFDKTEDITEERFDFVFGLNVRAQFFVGQHAYKYCQPGGRLILMSSIAAGLLGVADHALYSGSKSAVNGIVKSFATDFGTKAITVNAIAPGGVKSDMFTQVAWRYIPGASGDWAATDIERAMAENCPLKRCADPVDVARVVAFLAGEDAGWVNGKFFFIVYLFGQPTYYIPPYYHTTYYYYYIPENDTSNTFPPIHLGQIITISGGSGQ